MFQKSEKSGTMYIVATPIGNLDDITFRAINTLKSVDLILAEDTRSFSKIKKRYEISTKTESYHEHNERSRYSKIVDLLNEGNNIALVSDAGTPLISDPGFRLVRACSETGIQVVPIPGPSACITALSASGLETDQFIFIGFLPHKEGKKRKLIEEKLNLDCTVICYESPHRIIKTIKILEEVCPDRRITTARELTKIYEDIYTETPAKVRTHLEEETSTKGEFVLLIGKK